MRKVLRVLGRFLYAFAVHLPESYSKPQVGQRFIRRLCAKLILKNCGKDVNIEKGAVFSSDIEIGDGSGLGINSRISGKVIIGSNVMMGPCVSLYAQNHIFDRTDIPMNKQGFVSGNIIIEDDVWIGANSIILNNVTIGKGAIVGAGSVVTHNVAPYSIVGGNPAKCIRMRKISEGNDE